MSAMKRIYTHLQEKGIDPENCSEEDLYKAGIELGFEMNPNPVIKKG